MIRCCASHLTSMCWVYVSEQFDVKTITANIINSLTERKCEYTELVDLHGKLADEIEKRVLLVLDDVWNVQTKDRWDSLCAPLSATKICQIILTTRSEAVARMVETMPSYRPSCLSFDVSWSLFKQVAFFVEQEHSTSKRLIEVGKSIVKLCDGLPLAVKTVGSMLRCETNENNYGT
uniref:NB-ARC domain-containing protein n=1 Tax=Arundo donax TaxID=35708 RepID=A0A0A9B509_ARUDO